MREEGVGVGRMGNSCGGLPFLQMEYFYQHFLLLSAKVSGVKSQLSDAPKGFTFYVHTQFLQTDSYLSYIKLKSTHCTYL